MIWKKSIKSINSIISILTVFLVVFNLFAFSILLNNFLNKNEITVNAAGIPQTQIIVEEQPFLGEDFEFIVNFSNGSPTDVGFGPFVNLYLPGNGTDGASGTDTPDGITFNSATFLDSEVPATTFVFGDDDGNGPLTVGCIDHPFMVDSSNTPIEICGEAGDTLVVLSLPFGSFTAGQPTAEITVNATLSNLADLDSPLPIEAEGGFYLGGDELNNPSSDPYILETNPSTAVLNSQLILVEKDVDFDENETVTGPNFVREYTVSAKIADGQNIDNFKFTDSFPNNLVYQGVTNLSPGCVVESEPILTAPTNDAEIVIDCGTVTGGTLVEFTYAFYGADIDADGLEVIDHNSGDDVITTNSVSVSGDWVPIDTRDGSLVSLNSAPVSEEITLKSNSVSKNVFISNDVGNTGLTPGDTITYQINGDFSDYFGFEGFSLVDILSDGQRISSTPTISFSGSPDLPLSPANYSVIEHFTGSANPIAPVDGTTELRFNLSGELSARGLGSQFIGGCVQSGVAIDCDNFNSGPTEFTINFDAVVQDVYSDDFPSGDPSIDSRDIISNNVSHGGDVLDNSDTTQTTGQTEFDEGSTLLRIQSANISKDVYAVNGILGVPDEIMPGDEVTYRIAVFFPTTDAESVMIDDFLPLPTFDVNELGTVMNPYTGVPAAGTSSFGPNDTTFGIIGVNPLITIDPVSNKISYDFGTFSDTQNRQSLTEILFTVTVSDRPFEDGLMLTNQAQMTDYSTLREPAISSQIVQIELRSPMIDITKGIISSSNTEAVYEPSTTAPAAVNFQNPGSNICQSMTGVLNSADLANTPIDSNITGGVDGGDLIRYGVVLENVGGANVYDIALSDQIPAGLRVPTGGANLCIQRGDGTVLTSTDIDNTDTNPFFEDGIIIDDTIANPGLEAHENQSNNNSTTGRNIIIITYDLEVENDILLDTEFENTTRVLSFASVEGGFNHAGDLFDTSSTVILESPEISKSVSSINYPGNNTTDTVIGSIVTYESVITLDEGTIQNVMINDTLDSGLVLQEINSITYNSPDISSENSISDIINNAVTSASGFELDFGDIVNINSDNSQSETISINYDVVVSNINSNANGGALNNEIEISFENADGTRSDSSTQSSNVIIREPALQVVKDVSPFRGDSGDQFLVTLNVSHTGASTANAYNFALQDILPAGMDFVGPLNITGSALNPSSSVTGNQIDVTYDEILLGQTSQITFLVELNGSVSANEEIVNEADISWSSLQGDVSTAQSTLSGDTVERLYESSGSDNIRVITFTMDKNIIDTDINNLDVNGDQATTGNDVVIGEHIQYELEVNIPEGETDNVRISDLLDNGLVFVSLDEIIASPSISTSIAGGFPDVLNNASFSGTARTMTLDFGTLTNTDSDNNTDEIITIRYTVAVANQSTNQDGTSLNNRARLTWPDGGFNENAENVNVIEPELSINKVADVVTADNQDFVEYTVTVENNSSAIAFDVDFEDMLPGEVDFIAGSLSITAQNLVSTDTTNLPLLTANFSQIDIGETVTIEYRVEVGINTNPSQTITNDASLAWSSMLGDQHTNSSSTLINSSRERTGNSSDFGGSINDYTSSDSASFDVPDIILDKFIVSTSESDTVNVGGVEQVHIGEIVRYRLIANIPESTLTDISFVDNLPANMEYISDGTSLIAFVADSNMQSSNFAGGLETAGDINTTPTFEIPSSFITVDGDNKVIFELGDIVNQDNDNTNAEYIIIEFNALVKNSPENQDGTTIGNSYEIQMGAQVYGPTNIDDNDTIQVVEADFNTTKIITQTPNDAGDLIQYQISITNTGNTAAYNVNLIDLVDSSISIQSVIGNLGYTDNSTGQTVDLVVEKMDVNEVFTVTITGILQSSSTGQIIENVADVVYESLSTDSTNLNPTGSTNSNPAGDQNGPRNGNINSQVDDLNNYLSTGDVSFTVNTASIQKLDPLNLTYTIGEIVQYDILINLPEGNSINTNITDQIPDGLIYNSHSIITNSADSNLIIQDYNGIIPQNTLTGGQTSGEDINILLGDVLTAGDNNGLNNSFVIRIDLVVNNEIGNQDGTTLANTASLLIDGPNDTVLTESDSTNEFTVVEPALDIEKNVDDETATFGQEIEYTLIIDHENISSSDAYDVRIVDSIPSNVDYVVGSSVLPSGWAVDETDVENIIFTTDQLSLGQVATITFKAVVKSASEISLNQNIVNNADLTYSSLPGSNPFERDGSDTITGLNNYLDSDNAVSVVSSPELVIIKTDGNEVSRPGEVIRYELTIQNRGNNDSTNLVISELVPQYTTFDLAGSTSGWNCPDGAIAGTTCEYEIDQLNAGDEISIVFAVRIFAQVPSGVTEISNTVSVTDDGLGGVEPSYENNTDSDTNVLDAAPDLVVTKSDNRDQVVPGEVVTYDIQVSNIGNQTADNVIVTENIPDNSTYTSLPSSSAWNCLANTCDINVGSLDAGETIDLEFSVTIDSPVVSGVVELVNNINVNDDGNNGDDLDPTNNDDEDIDEIIAAPELMIEKKPQESSYEPGDIIVYEIFYQNNGDQDAQNVIIRESVPLHTTFSQAFSTPGFDCLDGSPANTVCLFNDALLGAGENNSIKFGVQINDSLISGVENIVNTLSISDDETNGVDPNQENNEFTVDVPVIAAPDIVLEKDDRLEEVAPGDTIRYELVVGNQGNQEATGVVVKDYLPSNVTYVSSQDPSGNQGNLVDGTVEFEPINLLAGEKVTFIVIVEVNFPAIAGDESVDNKAEAQDDGRNGEDSDPNNNSDDDSDILVAAPDLAVRKSDRGITLVPGEKIIYDIEYTNRGTQNATGIEILEVIPEYTTFDLVESSVGWDCVGNNCVYSISDLAVGQSGTIQFAVLVDDRFPSGVENITNVVQIRDDGRNGDDLNPDDNIEDEITSLNAVPNLAIKKTDNLTVTTPGEVSVYEIYVSNSGNQEATGVVVSETVQPGTTFDALNSTPGWSCIINSCTFEIDSIASGEDLMIEFAVTINDPLEAGIDNVVNTVLVRDDGRNGPEESYEDNSYVDETLIDATPDISIVKTDNLDSVVPGDEITYILTIENVGNQDSTGVVITDTLPEYFTYLGVEGTIIDQEITFDPIDIAVGEIITINVPVRVDIPQNVPAGLESVTNLATAQDDGTNGIDTNEENNSDTDTDLVDALPDLEITKTDNNEIVNPGNTNEYLIEVSNSGTQNSSNVVITETVPINTTFNSVLSSPLWVCQNGGVEGDICQYRIALLEANSSMSISFFVDIDEDVYFDYIDNSVSIDDDGIGGDDPTPDNNNDQDSSETIGEIDLIVSKTNDYENVEPGQTVIYTLSVTNEGNIISNNVELYDIIGPNMVYVNSIDSTNGSGFYDESLSQVSFNLFNINPGETKEFTVEVTIVESVESLVEETINKVSVSDDGTNGEEVDSNNNSSEHVDNLIATPDLVIDVEIDQETVNPGEEIVIDIDYTNVGNQDSTGVVISEYLPKHTYISSQSIDLGWMCEVVNVDGGEEVTLCTYQVGQLASGESGQVQKILNLMDNEDLDPTNPIIVDQATINDDGENGQDPTITNNTDQDTVKIPFADLEIVKTSESQTTKQTDTLQYKLTFRNLGIDDATGVVINDVLPEGLEFIEASRGSQLIEANENNNLLEFEVGDLSAGQEDFILVTTRVVIDQDIELINTASIFGNEADPEITNNSSSYTVTNIKIVDEMGMISIEEFPSDTNVGVSPSEENNQFISSGFDTVLRLSRTGSSRNILIGIFTILIFIISLVGSIKLLKKRK